MDANGEVAPRSAPENTGKGGEVDKPSNHEEGRATYKSFKKKYRKMRIKFDSKMQESNLLCAKEQQGADTAKRLAQENDQLLEFLLDVNNAPQIPAEKRIELNTETPSLSAVPPLISADELSDASQVNTPNGQAIYNEIRAMMDEKVRQKVITEPSKSLALLMSITPHLSTSNGNALPPAVRENVETLEGYSAPISYLTAEQIDEYLYDVDASLGSVPSANPHASPHQELALRNPHSVYNWLRRNEPKIFLQDGEGSEKSMGKPGSLRGAGKRASMPAPSKPDALEIVEEDGMRYDPTISGLEPAKGKRKREDDGGYHPKSGAPNDGKVKKSRPRKKKAEGEAVAAPPTSKRGKKARNSSPGAEAASTAANPA